MSVCRESSDILPPPPPAAGLRLVLTWREPDKIYLSSCLANAKPGCPYSSAEEMAEILKNKTGIEVVQGTHDYH